MKLQKAVPLQRLLGSAEKQLEGDHGVGVVTEGHVLIENVHAKT